MSLYYNIADVLDQVEKAGKDPGRLDMLVPVDTTLPHVTGRPEDIFQLASRPNLLDLTGTDAVHDLLMLLEQAPLYAIGLELAVDEALQARRSDRRLDEALAKAFAPDPIPASLEDSPDSLQPQTLRHPALSHMGRLRLCEVYVSLLTALSAFHTQRVNFERDVLGRHTERFTDAFDGFVTPQGSKVKASILLAFGTRLGHDTSRPMESYVSAGRKAAARMRITETREMIWAWMEADNDQMRHCRDLDRTLRLQGLPRLPSWVRYDVFSLLEKEAIKQYMAETCIQAEPAMQKLAAAPSIAKAMRANAEGLVDETLQRLLAESLNAEGGYSGSALRFAQAAEAREKESRRLGPPD